MTAAAGLDVQRLLADREWLRRLARRLAGDRDDLDDLVQDTLVAALERPPRDESPRGWLAVVLRNRARMTARAGARRDAREATAAAPDAPPLADDLLARAALLRDLAAAVVALPPPLRAVVLLRYDEGRSSPEIAAALGIAEGTVRWRAKEALDRLRAALDAERPAWRRIALPLVALGSPGRAALLGGLLVKKLVALVVVVLAAVLAVLLARRSDAPAPAAPPPVGPRAAAPAPARAAAASPAPAPPAGDRPVASRAPGLPGGAFGGRVVNWSTGAAVAGAELVFATGGATTSVTSDAAGAFAFVPPAAGAHALVTASAEGFLPYAPEWGTSPVVLHGRPDQRVDDVTVYLFPAIDYVGVVVAPDGRPVAGAAVRLVGAPQGEQALDRLPERFTTDAAGEFRFHAPDGAVFEARHPRFGPGRGALDGAATLTRRVTIPLAPRGAGGDLGAASIAGVVVDEGGAAVAGATVRATTAPPLAAPVAGVEPPPREGATDDAGRFVLDGLDPGPYVLEVSDGEHAPTRAEATAGARDVRVVLARGAGLRGRVRDASGGPVPAFTLVVLAPEGVRRRPVTTRSVIDAAGRFELPAIAPGAYLLVVAARGFAPSPETAVTVVPGSGGEVVIGLGRGATVTGEVRTRDGERDAPLPWARIGVEGVGGGASVAPLRPGTVTDEAGRFRLTGVPPGPIALQVAAADHHIRIVGGLVAAEGGALGPLAIALRPLAAGEAPQIELVGIGVKLVAGDDAVVVEEVAPGGGAAIAGVRPGDRILAIDGVPVAGAGIDAAVSRIRGVEGTTVRLGLRRGEGAPVELDVVRRPLRF